MTTPPSRRARAGVRGRFQRLRWKLALSYTLVTLAAVVVVELLILAVSWLIIITNAEATARLMTQELAREVAPQLAPLVATAPPDLDGLRRWLEGVRQAGLRTLDGEPVWNGEPEQFTGSGALLLVLDADQRVLGTLPPQTEQDAPVLLDAAALPGFGPLYSRALAGEQNVEHLYSRTPSQLTIVVPLAGAAGVIHGALVYSLPFGPLSRPFLALGVQLLSLAGLFTLVVSGLGALFGYLTARGLTRRLDEIARAAAAWGEGDFAREIQDASPDEIGQLGDALSQMAGQLQTTLTMQQQLGVLEERQRIARELHDSVKQQLFALDMNLAAAQSLFADQPEAAQRRLEIAGELARQAQRELATVIQTLRPLELAGTGLQVALRGYLERWQEQHGIPVTFESDGSASLPPFVEEPLYRVAQEALANVARHSEATTVQVMLGEKEGHVTLLIRDNGQGFDPQGQPPGVGLASMRERVEGAGGQLELSSGGSGTTLVATIPSGREGVSR